MDARDTEKTIQQLMSRQRTAYFYMTPDERRAYFRKKQQEHYERKATLYGRTVRHHDPNSHPSLMTQEERKKYKREIQRRYLERIKSNQNK